MKAKVIIEGRVNSGGTAFPPKTPKPNIVARGQSSKNVITKLPCFGIVVKIGDNGSGSIESDLHDNSGYDEEDFQIYESAINTVESLILAHACAGVDIESLAYIEGIEGVVSAIMNNI